MAQTELGSISHVWGGPDGDGLWGGPDGEAFSFKVGSWITQITVRADTSSIKSLAFKDALGQEYGVFGGNNPDNLGTDHIIELDGYSEYVKSISGAWGAYKGLLVVTSLTFVTNKSTYGPFSRPTGFAFSSPTDEGLFVNGFQGRGDYYLNAIGVHCQPLPPNVQGAISIGPWGGSGGDPWGFVTNKGINEIIISTGINITSISFRDSSGQASPTFGGMNPNNPGQRQTVQINWPAEHLISISGTYGNYNGLLTISSLSFKTNLNEYGPFGTPSTTSFSIPISNGTIVGFHGTAGYYLDSIAVFVKPAETTSI